MVNNKTMKTKSVGTLGMTGSYNSNSLPQLAAIQSSIPFIQQAIDVLDIIPSSFPIVIADFGSSHGVNSLYAMKAIIDYIKQSKETAQSFLVIHNDLETNDWTTVFDVLNQDKTYFGFANGRSFYEQCLPSNFLTIGYSSTCLHWLSRKPCEEHFAFKMQAQHDYAQFLENRSRELIQGGVLILTILCVDGQGRSMHKGSQQALYKCAQLLPLNEKELLDYTIPCYLRSYKECLNEELFKQCSLKLIKSDFCLIESNLREKYIQGEITLEKFAQARTGFIRSYSESALKQTLKMNETRSEEDIQQILNRFWSIYKDEVIKRPEDYYSSSYRTNLILKKI